MEMKTDVNRLPNELGKLPSVSRQLKLDEISTISKLAKGSSSPPTGAPPVQSVITQAPSTHTADTSGQQVKKEREVVIVQKKRPEGTSQSKVATVVQGGSSVVKAGQTIQIPAGSQLALQTADGLIMYGSSSATKSTQPATVVQAVSTTSTTTQQAYTIGVPAAYVDGGSGLYQAVQLVPVSGSTQQLVYWPVQGTQATQVSGVPVGSQIAVVQEPQVVQTVQAAGSKTTASGKKGASIITID